MLAPWASQPKARDNGLILARAVACNSEDSRLLLECLQNKPMFDIISAVDEMIRHGNASALFTPVIEENYLLNQGTNFLSENPEAALRRGNFKKAFKIVFNYNLNSPGLGLLGGSWTALGL
jgi:hypothetical protein